jgi:hypothetical protein
MTTGIPGSSTNPSLKPQTRVYIIFDKTSGEILHVHRSVIFHHRRAEHDTVARRLANKSANADILEVEEKEANQRKPLRVNVSTRRLVEK